MLDECKGERFEEVICTFATAVLRKHAQAYHDASLRLSCSDPPNEQETQCLLPLIIAHRHLLKRKLEDRAAYNAKLTTYIQLLDSREADLDARSDDVSSREACARDFQATKLQQTRHLVYSNWIGDSRWADIILEGVPARHDPLLDEPFKDGWKTIQEGKDLTESTDKTLVDELDERISKQKARLEEWKTFQVALKSACKPEERQIRDVDAPSNGPIKLNFDLHQALYPNACAQTSAEPPERQLDSDHQALLEAVRSELAGLAILRPERPTWPAGTTNNTQFANSIQGQIEPESLYVRHGSTGSEETISEQNERRNQSATENVRQRGSSDQSPARNFAQSSEANERSRPASDTSDAQHLAEANRDEGATAGSMRTFMEEHEQRGITLVNTSRRRVTYQRTPSGLNPEEPPHEMSGSVGYGSKADASPEMVPVASPASSRPLSATRPGLSNDPKLSDVEVTPKQEENISDSARPSFLERVRMSMSLVSSGTNSPPSKEHSSSEDESTPELPPPPQPQHVPSSRTTLLERTRESMSLLPSQPSRHSRETSIKQPRFSQLFPTNQFDTPRKPPTQHAPYKESARSQSPKSGSSTPRDHLFSDEADYTSVFKSRPRIALSPALSPEKSVFGLESMLEEGLEDLTPEK